MSFCGTREQCTFIVDLSTIAGRTKKKKKRERKTQNTKRKRQINLNPNGYWVLASAPVKPHPLPTPLGKTLLSSKKEKNVTKKIKKETPLFISGQKYKAYGKIREQDILYYAFRK